MNPESTSGRRRAHAGCSQTQDYRCQSPIYGKPCQASARKVSGAQVECKPCPHVTPYGHSTVRTYLTTRRHNLEAKPKYAAFQVLTSFLNVTPCLYYGLFRDAVCSSYHIASDGTTAEREAEQNVKRCERGLCRHSPAWTEENHEKILEYQASQPRFEPGTYRTQVRSVTG